MLTLAVISQKGGAGKTTLALNLAVAAQLEGETALVVDLDPQASAAAWHDSRDRDGPLVVSPQAMRLEQVLALAVEHGAAEAVIDTAPNSEAAALRRRGRRTWCSFPAAPGIFDLRVIAASADVASLARTPAARPRPRSASSIRGCAATRRTWRRWEWRREPTKSACA